MMHTNMPMEVPGRPPAALRLISGCRFVKESCQAAGCGARETAIKALLAALLAGCLGAAEPPTGGPVRGDPGAKRGTCEWPQWRGGPQRSGAVAEAPIMADLAAGANLVEVWRSEALPHGYGEQNGQVVGQGSPVVCDGKVYLYVNWPDPASVPPARFRCPKRVSDAVLCLDLTTGKTVWKTDMPGKSWRWGCSATPAVAAGRVVAMGSTGNLFCLDAGTGKELWHWPERPKFREDAGYSNVIGAHQSSPLIHEGLAIFSTAEYAGLIALDLATGASHWPSPKLQKGNPPGAWSSPCAWRHEDGWTVIGRNGGFDPGTGVMRWKGLEYGWSTPAVEGDRCAVMGGKGLRIHQLTATGPSLLVEIPLDNGSGNPAIHQGRVYACGGRKVTLPVAGLSPGSDRSGAKSETAPEPKPGVAGKPAAVGVMLCADALTGKVLWETTGTDLALGGGQWSFASPMVGSGVVCVLANRLLLFSAADGKRIGNPALQVPVLKCTSLALAGDCLIARDYKAVVCYRASKQ